MAIIAGPENFEGGSDGAALTTDPIFSTNSFTGSYSKSDGTNGPLAAAFNNSVNA